MLRAGMKEAILTTGHDTEWKASKRNRSPSDTGGIFPKCQTISAAKAIDAAASARSTARSGRSGRQRPGE